ncbi:MAG: hypothetical protein LQ345_002348 [Seirophora villosa]|nr:MAG: hypothetical protein LQ345_002348 [Seirophora villosa]
MRAEKPDFGSLEADVLEDIINSLYVESPTYLRELRLVSRHCKAIADPILYKSVELNEEREKSLITAETVRRLLDPADSLSWHVRKLVIRNRDRSYRYSYGDVHTFSDNKLAADDLVSIVNQLHHLQTFWYVSLQLQRNSLYHSSDEWSSTLRMKCLPRNSWDVNRAMPESLIDTLEQQWPHVKLTVGNHDRADVDIKLLASPLLTSLRFSTLNRRLAPEWNNRSLLPELRDVLLKSPNLRELNIEFELNSQYKELSLPLVPSDRLPALQTLAFSGAPAPYDFNLNHCQLLKRCVDWSHLRRLDLNTSCPEHLFKEIGGNLCNLQSLKMGIRLAGMTNPWSNSGPMTSSSKGPVAAFFRSVPGLLDLHIDDYSASSQVIAPIILDSQRLLQTLSYQAARETWGHEQDSISYAWITAHFRKLHERCPDLSQLVIDVPLDHSKRSLDYAPLLSRFHRLRTLKINVQLTGNASAFVRAYRQDAMGSVPMPSLNAPTAQDVAQRLFKDFFVNDAYSRLTDL